MTVTKTTRTTQSPSSIIGQADSLSRDLAQLDAMIQLCHGEVGEALIETCDSAMLGIYFQAIGDKALSCQRQFDSLYSLALKPMPTEQAENTEQTEQPAQEGGAA